MTGERQREDQAPEHEVVLSESEWQAVLLGARSLRDAAAAQRRAGTHMLAAENEEYAAALVRLGQRAEVAATHDPVPDITAGPQAHAELEAER
jgi:hypothetical protein